MIYPRTFAVVAACIALAGCGGGGQPEPTAFFNFQPAAVVLGQTDFESRIDGASAPNASSLSTPLGMALSPDGTLYVADWGTSRVLGYSGVPTTHGAAASFVLGQDSFTSNTTSLTASTHPWPTSISINAGKMAVTHTREQRVLLFDAPPTAPGTPANRVLGQPDFLSNGKGCSAESFTDPANAFITPDGKIIVADISNNRVLVWNSATQAQPSLVLGQNSYTSCAANDSNQDGTQDVASAGTLRDPSAVWSDGDKLVVADSRNHRVLIWNRFPTTNFQPADLVLGQSSFTNGSSNDDAQTGAYSSGRSARTLNLPQGIAVDGERLAIADSNNHRVLIWNRFPTTKFQPADVVLGQASFSAGTENDANQDGVADAGPSAKTLYQPDALLFHGHDLLVADPRNHRVLVFKPQ